MSSRTVQSEINLSDTLNRLRLRDYRFLGDVMQIHDPSSVLKIAEAWGESQTVWARREAVRYFEKCEPALGHELIVRRLINRAVSRQEIDVLAAAAVYTDHACRRSVNWKRFMIGVSWRRLQRPGRQRLRLPDARRWRNYASISQSRWLQIGELFSLPTRRHLQRTLWRAIRGIAKDDKEQISATGDSDRYVRCVSKLLRHTPEATISNHGSLLSAWCLMKTSFGLHPDLNWSSDRVVPKPGLTLGDLVEGLPGCFYQELWRREQGVVELERIMVEAKTDLVRAWARRMMAILR
ncbi:MAG: hypothetical protein AAF664_13940 [Planctomycetota bacterium]